MSDQAKKKSKYFDINISGPGVVSVSSSSIVQTDEAQRQIDALGNLVSQHFFSEAKSKKK